MPTISVVIPVYNGEKTIRETIESVLKQIFSDFEIIVINDGSQDTTLDLLADIRDPRIKVFSYANAGVGASRNRGITHSCGEYIAFLDADDLWTSDKLATQLEALESSPGAAVAYSWTDCINESGQLLGFGNYTTVNGDVLWEMLLGNFVGSGSNILTRAQALAKVGGFDETLTSAEDWDLYLRLAANYHFVAVPVSQVLYRLSSTSRSSNISRHEAESRKVLERAFARAPENLQHLKKHSRANLYRYLAAKTTRGLSRRSGSAAAKYLWRAIKEDISTLRHGEFIFTILFKITTMFLLSPRRARVFRVKLKNLIQGRIALH